jgi:hypothetical protein
MTASDLLRLLPGAFLLAKQVTATQFLLSRHGGFEHLQETQGSRFVRICD